MKELASLLADLFREGNRWVRLTITVATIAVMGTAFYMRTAARLDAQDHLNEQQTKRMDKLENTYEKLDDIAQDVAEIKGAMGLTRRRNR